MGWVIPLTKSDWNALVNKEMLAFAAPYPTVRAYSDARPIWFNRWSLPDTLRVWLLSMEEPCLLLVHLLCVGYLDHSISIFVLCPGS